MPLARLAVPQCMWCSLRADYAKSGSNSAWCYQDRGEQKITINYLGWACHPTHSLCDVQYYGGWRYNVILPYGMSSTYVNHPTRSLCDGRY
eukprot:3112553-Rhodomonas_salina.3